MGKLSFSGILGVVAISLGLLTGASSAADLKILVVNQAAVLQNSLAGKDERNKLRTIMETIAKEEQAKMDPIIKQAQDLDGKAALMDPKEVAQKQQEIQVQAQQVKFMFDQERQVTQERSRRLILAQLYPVFEEVMKEKGGTLLIEQSQVILVSPDFYITEDVVKKLDAKMPSVDVKRVTFAEIQKAVEEQRKAIAEAQKQAGGN